MKSLIVSMKKWKGAWDKDTGKFMDSEDFEESAGVQGEAPMLGSVSDGRLIILPSAMKGRRPPWLEDEGTVSCARSENGRQQFM